MIRKINSLAALISASLVPSVDAKDKIEFNNIFIDLLQKKNTVNISILNKSISPFISRHRSHSSHRSHRSHRSSSSYKSYSYPSYTPRTTYSPSTYNTEDDTNQRPVSPKHKVLRAKQKTQKQIQEQNRIDIIMSVQLTLHLEGMYQGIIDGKMGPKTREGIRKFQKKYRIKSQDYLGMETLNAMGIKGF